MIDEEIKSGIPSTKIILGGFSQGGAMSIFTGLTIKKKLAGVFGLSCYLVMGNKIKDLIAEGGDKNKDTPFFMGHGDADEVVKYQWGFKTAEMLKGELGIKNVDFRTYPYVENSHD
jgi:predicted esterase